MVGEQPSPVQVLREMLHACIPSWLAGKMFEVLHQQGRAEAVVKDSVTDVAESVSTTLLEQLDELLATDPDEQRANPLAVVRAALRVPTEFLLQAGATPVVRDEFAQAANPDDLFGIAPATWSDIDPRLHEPGLEWGAWKAATILMRRREEGLR
jgi:hypothetical protein